MLTMVFNEPSPFGIQSPHSPPVGGYCTARWVGPTGAGGSGILDGFPPFDECVVAVISLAVKTE